MSTPTTITRAVDGARILWRHWQADDTRANEGHVREFSRAGDYVRIARTCFKDDEGEWLRVSDHKLIDVLQARVEVKTRPRRKSEDDEEDAE